MAGAEVRTMSTEPTIVLIPHINKPSEPNTLELLTEQQEHYFGINDTYTPSEKLNGLCGSYKAADSLEIAPSRERRTLAESSGQ